MSEIDTEVDAPGLRLTELAASCSGGSCPTVYLSGKGTIVVQGYAVDGAAAGIDLPSGELLVEIPADLLAAAVRNQS
ncbi:hypothetical protein JKJ07_47515 [Actinoplanes sp. LDG1-01]|uniref:Uncharacterized protein n=2 Tax=Paractinoplanes lichenicola TaxID=2802976 RepID=A0ABS1W5C9_9ACTN|nr:hypothetical protein [Actinoplanes lichenicola]